MNYDTATYAVYHQPRIIAEMARTIKGQFLVAQVSTLDRDDKTNYSRIIADSNH